MIIDNDEWILIDSSAGTAPSITALAESIAQATPKDSQYTPRLVINTHGHVNNAGGDWWLHELGALIAARLPDSKWIEMGDPQKTGAKNYGIEFHPTPVGWEVKDKEEELEVGSLKLLIIHTPGHTPGSQSVYLEDNGESLMVIGDALGSLSVEWESSEDEWWSTYYRIREFSPTILCTSVKCYIGEAVKELLREAEKAGPEWIAGQS